MTEVLLNCARTVLTRHPFPRLPAMSATALLIAGHGTEQNENSRQAIERQVDLIRARNLYASVHSVFLEEQPFVADWHELTAARNIVVTPFFMSTGLHTQQDIPILLGEAERTVVERLKNNQPPWRNPTEKRGRLIWYSEPAGADPSLAEVILDCVRDAASRLG